MTFLLDAQISPKIGRVFEEAGYSVKLVREVGLRDANDSIIWQYALAHGDVIVTKDADFAILAERTNAGPPVVWLRIGNCDNVRMSDFLIPFLPEIVAHLKDGDRLIEVG